MSLLPASSTEKEYNETCWEFLCFLSLADDLSVGMKHGECQRGWSSTVWQRKVGCDQEVCGAQMPVGPQQYHLVNKDKAPSLTWNFIAFPWDVTWQKMSEMIFPSHPQGPVGINFTITPSRARSEWYWWKTTLCRLQFSPPHQRRTVFVICTSCFLRERSKRCTPRACHVPLRTWSKKMN